MNAAEITAPQAFTGLSTKRQHLGWLEREDNHLLESILAGKKDPTLVDLCTKFSRDPLSVLARLRDSDIPDMLGFEQPAGSEEEAEFNGLALSGVGLRAAFLWCTASDDRPSAQMLSDAMAQGDLRDLMHLARNHHLVLACADDLTALQALGSRTDAQIKKAVAAIVQRFDIATPRQVLDQLSGKVAIEKAFDWSCPQSKKKGSYLKKSATGASSKRSTTGTTRRKSSYSRSYSGTSAYKPARKSRWSKWKKSASKTQWAGS